MTKGHAPDGRTLFPVRSTSPSCRPRATFLRFLALPVNGPGSVLFCARPTSDDRHNNRRLVDPPHERKMSARKMQLMPISFPISATSRPENTSSVSPDAYVMRQEEGPRTLCFLVGSSPRYAIGCGDREREREKTDATGKKRASANASPGA